MKSGMHPFWFWNGEMEDASIIEQIEEMQDQGIEGFIICPRQGLKIPYLSRQWFEKVKLAVGHAKGLGMVVWLYDEQPYPSGVSGGQVILDHPEFEAKSLHYEEHIVRSGESLQVDLPWGEVLLARAYRKAGETIDLSTYIDLSEHIGMLFREEVYHECGLTHYNNKRFLACNPGKQLRWECEEGEYILYIFMQVPLRGHKYFDGFVDPLNKNAVKYFITTTHERYKSYMGDEFGATIKGFFTDEVHPRGYEGNGICWSPLLPQLFEERYGKDLIPLLPALVRDVGTDTARIRYEFMNTVVEGFIESYDQQILEWCHENKLLYIGEKPILRSRQLKYMDIPGIDAGHQKAGTACKVLPSRYRANPKVVSSAAFVYEKKSTLCECFHSIGWGMNIQDMKWIMDMLALMGINMFVNHAYYYSTQGLRKHDAPPSSFIQMPWWKHQIDLSTHMEKILTQLNQNNESPRIILLENITSTWTTEGSQMKKIKEDFSELQEILIRNNYDFYIMDQEDFSELSISNQQLHLHGESFDYLLLPAMTNIEDPAFKNLNRFIQAGGQVIAYGTLPSEEIGAISKTEYATFYKDSFGVDINKISGNYEVDSKMNPLLKKKNCTFVDNYDDLLQYLHNESIRSWYIENQDRNKEVLLKVIGDDKKKICFLQNLSSSKQLCQLVSREGLRVDCEIGPLEFMSFDPENVTTNESQNLIELPMDECHKINLRDQNTLRLYEWDLRIGDDSSRVTTQPIIDQLEQGQFMIPAIRKDKFGTSKILQFSPLTCNYSISFYIEELQEPYNLVIEKEAIHGQSIIKVNDNILATELKKEEVEDHHFILPLHDLCIGENKIDIQVKVEKSYEGLINPIYIKGNFATKKRYNQWYLQKFRDEGYIKDREESGLPHYAGTIDYYNRLHVDLAGSNNDYKVYLTDKKFRDAADLIINGVNIGRCSWQPYMWNVPKEILKHGENEYTLSVKTDLLGYYEGAYYDFDQDQYKIY